MLQKHLFQSDEDFYVDSDSWRECSGKLRCGDLVESGGRLAWEKSEDLSERELENKGGRGGETVVVGGGEREERGRDKSCMANGEGKLQYFLFYFTPARTMMCIIWNLFLFRNKSIRPTGAGLGPHTCTGCQQWTVFSLSSRPGTGAPAAKTEAQERRARVM